MVVGKERFDLVSLSIHPITTSAARRCIPGCVASSLAFPRHDGRADVLVTMNIRDFAVAGRFRLKVATPGAFLRQLREE
jgi:hypothetical protein